MGVLRARRPNLPTSSASAQAAEAVQRLSRVRATDAAKVVVKPEGAATEDIAVVPREAFDLFLEVLAQLADGNAVSVVPIHAELTTQQAADLLNVSRPYLIELLDTGKIPSRLVGTHRRVRYTDLVAYQQEDDARRAKLLDALTAESQELKLGY